MHRLIIVLLCLLALGAQAEEEESPVIACTVTGVVLDESGNPLPGASVWVKGSTIGAGTNSDGKFNLSLRKGGQQILRFSFTGYIPQEYVLEQEVTVPLIIRLKPAENSLDEVVITGTRTPKPLKEVPVLTRVISEENIQQLNPPDLQTLLEFEMPGLQFGQAHGSGLPELKFQGASGGYVLFLLNGERLAGEGSSNNIDYSRIDVDHIKRIEVVKGPMSTLYGSQAMGGVVNIITKDADRPFTGTVSAQYSDKGDQKYSVSGGTRSGRFSSYTTLSYRYRDAYTVDDQEGFVTEVEQPDGTVVKDTSALLSSSVKGNKIRQVDQKFGYSFTDDFKLTLNGSYYNNHVQQVYESKKQDVYSTYTINPCLYYTLKDNHLFSLSYLLENYEKKYEYKTVAADKVLGDLTHTLRLNYSGELGKHMVTAGLEIYTQRLQHYWFDNGSGKKFDAQTYVFYLQEEWKMSGRFSLVAGIRSDCNSDYGFHASPKVSLMYRTGVLALRGGYGMGFRLPTLKELHSEYDMGGQGMFMIYGNEELKPETSHQGTLSAEVTKGVFNGSVSGYYTKYKDEIALGLTENGEDQQYHNIKDGTKSGVDVMAQFRFGCGLTLQGAYAYVDANEETDGRNTSTARPHSLTFGANYSRKVRSVKLSVGVNGRWMSKVDVWYKSDGNYVLNPYEPLTVCNLNLAGNFPHGFRLILGIDNLLNFKEKNVSSDASIFPQRGIGFTGTLSVNVADLFKL